MTKTKKVQVTLEAQEYDALAEVARRNGMRTLSDDGWRLVHSGITTPEEVLRVTKDQALNFIQQEAELEGEQNEEQVIRKAHARISV